MIETPDPIPVPLKVMNDADFAANAIRQQVNTNQDASPPPKPFVKAASQFGVFEIGFTRPIIDIPDIIDLNSLEYAEETENTNTRMLSSG